MYHVQGRDVFLQDVRVVVEDIGNHHENSEFGIRIKEDLLEDDEKEMLKNMSEIQEQDRTRLSCLKKVEKRKLFAEVRKVNEILKKIKSKDMTEGNKLLYLGAALVTKVFEKK